MSRFKKIYVEITNVCNLSCDFCPKTGRDARFMDIELFRRVINQAKPLCDEITLHVMGEPLLHPEIDKIIRLAEEIGVKINLTTNGTLIAKHQEVLLNDAIRRINFSIHGLLNLNTEKYLKSIIDFTKKATEERGDLLIIYRLWNLQTRNSNNLILDLLEKEFDVSLEIQEEKKSMKIKNNNFIHYDGSFDWPNPNNPLRSEKGYCHGLSTHIGILADGTVVPCCLDNEGSLAFGNIKEKSLSEILQSERAVHMREGFKRRMLVEDLCKRCTYIKRFEKEKDNKN